ncbi:MAG: RNA polymerase sigma factor [Candidatus Hydrogenedentes bacterium]|nr:RNA polymerase sigma factor [Candidatus Hydrogenedentota bacterium]
MDTRRNEAAGRTPGAAEENGLQAEHEDYERLIEPIEAQMLRAVWGVTQNADDAEEALQEALTLIWRKLGRIRRHANPHALILRICLNTACDVVRKKLRRRRREAHTELLTPRPGRSPADEAAAQEQHAIVLEAVGKLSRNQSTAVLLRLVQGQSYQAIAEALGCKDATARKHVARGRERLQEMLSPIAPHLAKEPAQ